MKPLDNSKTDMANIESVRKIKIHMNWKMYWNSFQRALPFRFHSINKSFYFVFFIFDLLHDLLALRQVLLEKKVLQFIQSLLYITNLSCHPHVEPSKIYLVTKVQVHVNVVCLMMIRDFHRKSHFRSNIYFQFPYWLKTFALCSILAS